MRKGLPAIRFRPFETADSELLEPWLETEGLGVPPAIEPEEWGRRLAGDPRIVCRLGIDPAGRVVGFYRLDLAPDRTAEVTLLSHPNRRRAGLGRALLDAALEEARGRGLRRLVAVIDEENRAAREFFLSSGFEEAGASMPRFLLFERMVHGAGHQPPLEIVP